MCIHLLVLTFYFADFIFVVRQSSAKIGSLKNFRLYSTPKNSGYHDFCADNDNRTDLFTPLCACAQGNNDTLNMACTTYSITTKHYLLLLQCKLSSQRMVHSTTATRTGDDLFLVGLSLSLLLTLILGIPCHLHY